MKSLWTSINPKNPSSACGVESDLTLRYPNEQYPLKSCNEFGKHTNGEEFTIH